MEDIKGEVFNFNNILNQLYLSEEMKKIQDISIPTVDILKDLQVLLNYNRETLIRFLVTDHCKEELYGLVMLAFRDKESLDFIFSNDLLPDATKISPEPVSRLFCKLLYDCAQETDPAKREGLQKFLKKKITQCEELGIVKSVRFTPNASQIYTGLFDKKEMTLDIIMDKCKKLLANKKIIAKDNTTY